MKKPPPPQISLWNARTPAERTCKRRRQISVVRLCGDQAHAGLELREQVPRKSVRAFEWMVTPFGGIGKPPAEKKGGEARFPRASPVQRRPPLHCEAFAQISMLLPSWSNLRTVGPGCVQ